METHGAEDETACDAWLWRIASTHALHFRLQAPLLSFVSRHPVAVAAVVAMNGQQHMEAIPCWQVLQHLRETRTQDTVYGDLFQVEKRLKKYLGALR